MGEPLAGTSPEPQPVDLRTHLPHRARIYDSLLGGKTNFAADPEQAEQALATIPAAASSASGALSRRGTGHPAFLDIGAGIPTSPNLHEVHSPSIRQRGSCTPTTTPSC
jgi:hypothetical protein